MKPKLHSEIKTRHPRCKQVLVILNHRLETLDLVREQVHPPVGDFAEEPLELAVVRWHGLEVLVPLECVVFLSTLPPEPQWIRDARAKVEQEIVAAFPSDAKRAHRAQAPAGKRVAPK